MIRNYFKIAWRNIVRQKSYTAINILGLAFGICACMVIYLITQFEFSFDKFHPDGDRIYRIVGNMQRPGGEQMFLNSPISDVAGFQTQIPGFESKAAFFTSDRGTTISIPQANQAPKKFDNLIPNSYSATSIITWPEYFAIFKYKWLAGSASSLNQPFKVILTEGRGKKYFGDIPASAMIGKTVVYDDSLLVSVSGIVADWKGNSDFGYTDFISISTATHSFLKNMIATDDWSSLRPHGSMALVKLDKSATVAQINQRFASFIKQNIKFTNAGMHLTMYLQPLSELHFTPDFRRGDDGDDFRKAYLPTLYVLMGVAIFILILAAVNFINLSTAQSIQRTKEIGVRKVMGSKKINITIQFLVETFLLTCLAVIASVLLVNPLLYMFKDYIPAGIHLDLLSGSTIAFLIGITIVSTLLAGFYPARVLSSYMPALSLKGDFPKGKLRFNLRRSLIVFQFTVSLIFIIATLVMSKQMRFMMNASKGFNTDAIITINKWGDHSGKLKILADEVRRIGGVDKVALQGNSPMGFAQMSTSFQYKGIKEVNINSIFEVGNEQYIPLYQMKIVAGRNLTHSDSLTEVVVNETFAKSLGFDDPSDAIGKTVYASTRNGSVAVPVVGIVADFHQGSFHDVIQPAVIGNMADFAHSVAIKLTHGEKNTAEVKRILAQMQTTYKKFYPDENFDYSFLNESITRLYEQEEKTGWLLNAAMIITVFISCMGLFGLGMFTAKRKTKEIGIRKVLGASVTNISAMLSKEFIILVAIGFLIASPIAYYLSHKWLQDFAYRTNIDVWVFLIAGVSAAIIALATVSFQAIKASIANPVKSLRNE